MVRFKHYILTKFNLNVYSGDNIHAKVVKDPEQWMHHRKYLFENYTLRSVMRQTCKDFTWIIGYDPKTPKKWLTKYDYIDNIQIVFGQPHFYLRSLPVEADWLVTSRIDNDDWYYRDFVAAIQGEVVKDHEIIDVRYITSSRYDPLRERANSPFLSVCEPWGDKVLTAFGRPHTNMVDELPAKKINRVLAAQIIHDRNVNNHKTIHEKGRIR